MSISKPAQSSSRPSTSTQGPHANDIVGILPSREPYNYPSESGIPDKDPLAKELEDLARTLLSQSGGSGGLDNQGDSSHNAGGRA